MANNTTGRATSSARLVRSTRARSGFTLIEALVSLIMFAFIMGALSLAFNTVTRAQDSSEVRQNDNGNVRVILDNLKRDIQGAYASANDPQSIFIGGGTATGSGQNEVASPGLLCFSTTNYVIQAAELSDPNNTTSAQSGALATDPQSGVQIVRYDLDTGANSLVRSVTTVPNLNLVTEPQPGDPTTIIGKGVVSLTLQYWDPIQNTWRSTWDYEQSNLSSASGGTGTTGATGTTQAAGSTTTTQPGGLSSTPLSLQNSGLSTVTPDNSVDTYFPYAVKVTLVVRNSAGKEGTYEDTFVVVAGQPFTDPSSTTATSTAATTGG